MPTPAYIEVGPGLFIPRGAVRYSFSRGSGPGGQNVNKVSSRVQLHVALDALDEVLGPAAGARLRAQAAARITEADELMIVCEESRSQLTNRRACLARLRQLVNEARKAPRVRKATRPSKRAKARRVDEKTRRARIKQMRRKPRDE